MADRRDFLGTGWRFPVRVGAGGGLDWSSGERSVTESIWIVLSTAEGERLMEPHFGCGIHELLFANNDAATHAAIAHHVQESLTNFEPRIDVLDVRVTDQGELGNVLLIGIDYRIRANNTVHNLVYPFYAREGELR